MINKITPNESEKYTKFYDIPRMIGGRTHLAFIVCDTDKITMNRDKHMLKRAGE
jgi:hypothetical protein